MNKWTNSITVKLIPNKLPVIKLQGQILLLEPVNSEVYSPISRTALWVRRIGLQSGCALLHQTAVAEVQCTLQSINDTPLPVVLPEALALQLVCASIPPLISVRPFPKSTFSRNPKTLSHIIFRIFIFGHSPKTDIKCGKHR